MLYAFSFLVTAVIYMFGLVAAGNIVTALVLLVEYTGLGMIKVELLVAIPAVSTPLLISVYWLRHNIVRWAVFSYVASMSPDCDPTIVKSNIQEVV
jgi:hypothetical protein